MAAAHVLVSGHHASSHQASEFLHDRLPNPKTSFALKVCLAGVHWEHHLSCIAQFDVEVQNDEVAVAYGKRSMPKLVEVLSLPDLTEACGIACLQLLLSFLGSQASTH